MNLHQDVRLDFDRRSRMGLEEAILAGAKSVEHLTVILDQAAARNARFLFTRLAPEQFDALPEMHRARLDYDRMSRTAYFGAPEPLRVDTRVVVLAAGTSDTPVLREVSRTLAWYGEPALEITDVGVAGIWRLLERVEEIRHMPVVVAVAGMDAALPTVVGGLVSGVVIGVPTSVGYGVAAHGQTALNAMLASCAAGLLVTNIDNGFGAACAALRVLGVTARAHGSSSTNR
ncbi:MAG: nickel pincer cofactor biosynthesis protein LarB [Burkholderiales bacterium]|nr:nickel pincer cofactor biosynthesis protein LarB [Burkholderiales bacterium]